MSTIPSPLQDLVHGHVSTRQLEFLSNVVSLGVEFIDRPRKEEKFLSYKTLPALKALIMEPLPSKGISLDKLTEEIKAKIVEPSISQSHPGFLAFPDTANSIAGLAADVLVPFINQNLIAVDRSAPSATMVELQVISWLRELAGYDVKNPLDDDFTLGDVGGLWTTGGNMSNHIAVLAALHSKFPAISSEGMVGLARKPAMVLAKGIEHFSFPAAARALGIGDENIIWTAASADFTTDPKSLRDAIKACPSEKEPFIVVCVAGNCRTTNIDSIRDIKRVCNEFGLWLHVDACHGGSLLFSEESRGLLDAIHLADSISIDPHKGLFVAYPCSYVLFKDPSRLKSFCRYPQRFSDPDCLDLGLISPHFGSRGFHSLKLWCLIKNLGMSGLSECISARAVVNRRMTERLEATGLVTFLNTNEFYRQAFVLLPPGTLEKLQRVYAKDEVDRIQRVVSYWTAKFAQTLYERGLVCFDHFTLTDLNNRVGLGSDKRYDCCAMAIGHCEMDEARELLTIDEVFRVGESLVAHLERELEEKAEVELPMMAGASPASW